jgi:hypothetical protein
MEFASNPTMPRKQRFKPSRKPKPTPPNEDALNVRQPNSGRPHNDNGDARDSPPAGDEGSTGEPELDQRST